MSWGTSNTGPRSVQAKTRRQRVKDEPIFVVGAPRSGTSFTAVLLGAHSNVHVYSEIRLIELAALAGFTALNGGRTPRTLAEQRIDQATLAFGRAYTNLLLSHQADAHGVRQMGDKYPPYSMQIPTLDVMYPRCKVVHIIRDGRAMAASWVMAHIKQRGWRRGPDAPQMTTAANTWTTYVRTARRDGMQLGPQRYFEFRYEDLLEPDEQISTALLSFLGEKPDQSFAERMTKRRAGRQWSQVLSPDELHTFHSHPGATELLAQLGYPETPRELLTQGAFGPAPIGPTIKAGLAALQAGDNETALRHLTRAIRHPHADIEADLALLQASEHQHSVFGALRCRDRNDLRVPSALARWAQSRGLDPTAVAGVLGPLAEAEKCA